MIEQSTQTDVGKITPGELALEEIQTFSVHLRGTVATATDGLAVVFILTSAVIADEKLEQTADPTTDRHTCCFSERDSMETKNTPTDQDDRTVGETIRGVIELFVGRSTHCKASVSSTKLPQRRTSATERSHSRRTDLDLRSFSPSLAEQGSMPRGR